MGNCFRKSYSVAVFHLSGSGAENPAALIAIGNCRDEHGSRSGPASAPHCAAASWLRAQTPIGDPDDDEWVAIEEGVAQAKRREAVSAEEIAALFKPRGS